MAPPTSEPQIGRTVVYHPPPVPKKGPGSPTAPREQAAIITALAGDGFDVHLTVFPYTHGGDSPSTPFDVENVVPHGSGRGAPKGVDPAPHGTWRYPEVA